MPACRVDRPCSARATGVLLTFTSSRGAVSSTHSGRLSRYRILLAPGSSRVRASASASGLPGGARLVEVPAGLPRELDLTRDSGVR